MTPVDPDSMPPESLVAQFVLECRGQGFFLPYADHDIIAEWLAAAPSKEDLLLVLSEVLPPYFEGKGKAGGPPRSLAGVRKLVLACLKERRG